VAKKVAATTIGCKVNSYDTQAVLQTFVEDGYEVTNFEDMADVYIVNTCSVTNLAEKKSRQMIRRAKGRKNGAIVAAMGCASQISPQVFKGIGVDIVIGTSNKDELLKHVEKHIKSSPVVSYSKDIFSEKDFGIAKVVQHGEKTRATLKIQDGCNNFCSFCIIPHARGLSRSRPLEDVISQAQIFADGGYKEIVVSGIHVASYGKDLYDKVDIVDVLAEICRIPNIERVRLSSVEPNAVTDKFLEFVKENAKFCHHLHLSLQSGSDDVLRAMKRKYSADEYALSIERLRKAAPDISITTDIIAGFPGETDKNHIQTLTFLKNLQLASLHVFPYSAKEGTPAAKMKQVDGNIKKKRAAELVLLGKEMQASHQAGFLGQTAAVLVEERNAAGLYEGKTSNYLTVVFDASYDCINKIVNVELEAQSEGFIFGREQLIK